MAVEYKGSKCMVCGYNRCIEALEFHHNNSTEKDFSISEKGYTRSWAKVKEELDKCMLLCANCHREIHAQQAQLPRETADETAGELLEARMRRRRKGNQQPSPAKCGEGSETMHLLPKSANLWQRYSPSPKVISGYL